ncbi:hypothetical protein ABZX40_37850 [Streptomyces sp. NPDC004610]|uniref:hypothetical protein n=1 Tax=unclassified Streptomyces TaxID=2593676 RepID=UPI0033ADAFB0
MRGNHGRLLASRANTPPHPPRSQAVPEAGGRSRPGTWVRVVGPAKDRAQLAEDTAAALELIETASRAGHGLTMPDALCAAAARRLEVGLIAADLLTSTP